MTRRSRHSGPPIVEAIGVHKTYETGRLRVEALTGGAIVAGTSLGLVVAYNVVANSASQPGYENLRFAPPWVGLLLILTIVFMASIATTWAPARRASRIMPADALRYE
ncbi:MAG TPA: hypothetical protein VFA83_08995 [Acidimicrobiales bacterium]|nr:hypothetical protein [Acidimicrobiales bacterium]